MEIFITILAAYLIGSFPSSYLYVKMKFSKDITKLGSGNAGTLNTFETTSSKSLAAAVLISDILKGSLAVLFPYLIFNSNQLNIIFAAIFVIIGHNYSVFLKFKGGRGLAAAVGVFLVINPLLIISWLLLWLIFYKIKRSIHFGNIAASLTAIIPVFIMGEQYFVILNSIADLDFAHYIICSSAILLILILSHTNIILEKIKK